MVQTTTDPQAAASEALGRLEDRGDRATLLLLATVYEQLADLARRYAAVLDTAARLREQTAAYDRALLASNADNLVDRLEAAGVAVFQPRGTASAPDLRAGAGVCVRLGRWAREAAATKNGVHA